MCYSFRASFYSGIAPYLFGLIFTRIDAFYPGQGWARKTVDNVIYIWAKPCVALVKLSELEVKTGKEIKLCVVPNAIMKYAGI